MKLTFGIALLAFAVVGCSGGADSAKAPSPSTAASTEKKTFKVALLTPGPTSDAGWSAMAYDGLMDIQKQTGAQVDHEEAESPEKIKDSMRSYAQKGYDLIFGHGFEYNAPEIEVAKDFPKTVFVSSSGDKTSPNAGAFRFELEQGFYIAGVLAAKLDKTGTVAMIGGDKVPSIQSTFDAFSAGAKATKPQIKVLTVYTGDGNDVAKAKEATLNAIGQGADLVIHQADNAAQGVFEACKEKNVYAIGSNLDQNKNATGIVIGSAIIAAGPAFVDLAKEVQAGTYKGSVANFGVKQGAIDFVINPALQSKVPADVQKLLDDTKSKIKAGTLTVPEAKF